MRPGYLKPNYVNRNADLRNQQAAVKQHDVVRMAFLCLVHDLVQRTLGQVEPGWLDSIKPVIGDLVFVCMSTLPWHIDPVSAFCDTLAL